MSQPEPVGTQRGATTRGMESLRAALARLERRGYCDSLRPRPGGLLEVPGEGALAPETLVVEELVRFEGESDPEDQAVLFALRSRDGRVRGTLVAAYGIGMDPEATAAVRRLEEAERRAR